MEIVKKGIERVELLKTIEEQDPPLLDADEQVINESFRILRQMEIKYELQSGKVTPDQWKKKIEDTYQDRYHRSLCAIESLTTEDTQSYIPIEKKGKAAPWKKEALVQAVQLINPDIEKVKEALVQVHEHKKRAKDQAGATFKSENPEAEVDEMLETHKKLNEEMIKETDWKESSNSAPLEIHIQLIIFAYETENRELFEDLLKSALIRLKFRRYEVPYVSTVDILMSTSKDANIPNGFEKLPKDLNHANIKAELEKLRKADKKKDKEEEEKKDPIKAKDKGKGKDKGKEKVELPDDDDDDEEKIDATPEELEKIKHIYINLLIQKSRNPKNAIIGLDVVVVDESIEYDIPENHYAVAVPIGRRDEEYDNANTILYILFKRTANFLRDEEDLLSLVTDVVVITGKSPNILPPLGYKKIPLDLRQTPHELERSPDIDCVFLCYKTDKDINIYERDILTLKKLSDLSHSFVALEDPKYKEISQAHRNLDMIYDFELLTDITKNVKDSLLGPVGTFYSRERNDQLDCLARILLNDFILPVRRRMEQFFELKTQGELVEAERIDFKEILLRIHQILAKNTQTKKELTLIYLIASIYLSNICEEEGDFRSSIRIMRSALMRVVETREHRLKNNLEYSNNPTSEMHFHSHGYKILQTRKAKEERYKIWENLILRNERERERHLNSQTPLDEDEADEESSEIERIEREKHALQDFIRQQRKEGQEEQEEVKEENWEEKTYYKYYSTLDDLLNDLHIETLACLYRCEIKQGNSFKEDNLKTTKMLKIKGIKAPNEATQGLSTTLKKKFTLKKTKSIAEATNKFKQLEVTLQEAGKLPVTRPPPANYEKMIILENSHNVYQSAIFSMQVASSKGNKVEQKSLLLESLDFLKKASEDEEKLKKIIIDNSAAVKIAEHLMNYEERGDHLYEKQPLSLMDKQRYLKKTVVPPKPIFIARTCTTITMKLPYFRPQTDHKEWRNITKMALFGKESGSGVAVSLNNTEFPGTGDKIAPGSVITVSNLTPNRKYVFACGGYTDENICVNGIGETCEEILTTLQLNVDIMLGYLSQTAFKLGHLNISKKAAELLLSKYIEKNETRYKLLNGERNPALLYKLKYSEINDVSVTTIRQIVEGFLLIAGISRLQKPKIDHSPNSIDSVEVRQTKLKLRICNFLLMALELVIILKNPSLIKRTISELFNFSLPFLNFDPKPIFIKNYLIYAHQAILKIPDEFMDGSMRKIGSCLGYEINKNESSDLYVKLMKTELAMDLRKWQTYSQVVTKLDELTEEEVAKQQEQKELVEKGEEVPEEELVKDPEPYDVTETYCIEVERESKAYEEFLLMFHDEFTTERVDKWKAKLNKLIPALTNGEEVIQKITDEMDSTVEFWKNLKEDPETQINNQALKENPRFLEFTCKALQRVIEIGEKTDEEVHEIIANIDLDQETLQECEDYIKVTKENLSKDTVQRRQNRFNLIEEKVKNILEEAEGTVDISMVELDKLFGAIRTELASGEQFQKTEYSSEKLKYFLNVSQYLFLQAMIMTMTERKKFEYSKDTGLPTYQNIQLLEFDDMVVQVMNFNDEILSERNRIRSEIIENIEKQKAEQEETKEGEGEEKVPELKEIEVPVNERVKSISEVISLLSKASQYCCNSKSWVLLENIVKYTWNLITYELVSPLELSQTDAYKDIFLITESVLNLLSQAKLVKENETEILSEAGFEPPISIKTVKFAEDTLRSESTGRIKVPEKDLKFYSDFIAYTVQCLFVAEKWESMVDLADTANKQLLTVCPEMDDNMSFLSLYLYQFRIYGEDKLYTSASQQTDRVKKDLAVRVAKFNQWKATSKKSKSRTAMLTGEVPKEELQFRKEKAELENEIFRLEVHETILRSDKSESQEERTKIKKSSNNIIEELRQSRKLYQKYGIESTKSQLDLKLPGEISKFSSNRKVDKSLISFPVMKYTKVIEKIRKKKEKFLLIQSLHEIGNLYFSDDQLGNAEVQWND